MKPKTVAYFTLLRTLCMDVEYIKNTCIRINFSSFLKLILNIKQQRCQLGLAGPQHGSVEGP